MTRHVKTPRQRAEEQLALANRAYDRLTAKAKALRGELQDIEREQRAALARRDHLAQHPDLEHNPTTTSTGDTA